MTTLSNKIDFAAIVSVNHANPNGDPLNGNRPRVTYDGLGEISDVCLKRKIRNRLQDMEHSIFVQSDDNKIDDYSSLRARAEGELGKDIWENATSVIKESCKKWIDVRAFGQIFPYSKGAKGEGVSIPVRGPVSIHPAYSVGCVLDRVSSLQITKSASSDTTESGKRASDTMGMKHRVDHGVYVFYGSMNPQLAGKTGFSDEDADAIKEALRTMFVNDASSARPEGSIEVHRVYWWKHNCSNGQYSSAKVHRLLTVKVKDEVDMPKSIEDYEIHLDELDGLDCEEIIGL